MQGIPTIAHPTRHLGKILRKYMTATQVCDWSWPAMSKVHLSTGNGMSVVKTMPSLLHVNSSPPCGLSRVASAPTASHVTTKIFYITVKYRDRPTDRPYAASAGSTWIQRNNDLFNQRIANYAESACTTHNQRNSDPSNQQTVNYTESARQRNNHPFYQRMVN